MTCKAVLHRKMYFLILYVYAHLYTSEIFETCSNGRYIHPDKKEYSKSVRTDAVYEKSTKKNQIRHISQHRAGCLHPAKLDALL